MFGLAATWAFDFLLWAAGLSLRARNNPTELTNLWAERSQPVFTSSHVSEAALLPQLVGSFEENIIIIVADIHKSVSWLCALNSTTN